jgi:hypothetical protein
MKKRKGGMAKSSSTNQKQQQQKERIKITMHMAQLPTANMINPWMSYTIPPWSLQVQS